MEWAAFEREWTGVIIESVNEIRAALGITVKELGERVRKAGWPVSDATLSGMLSGNKRSSISIAEIAAFGSALDVPPLYLILGLPKTSELPDSALWPLPTPDIYDVWSWFNGMRLDKKEGASDVSHSSYQALWFVERAAKLSSLIHAEIIDLVALSELQSLPERWREARRKQVIKNLESHLSTLRRQRARQKNSAEKRSLSRIYVPPMPEILGFVDGSAPLKEGLDALNQDELRELTSSFSVSEAKSRLEGIYDTEPDEIKEDLE